MEPWVEVVAAFGDTLIDVRLLPPGGGYRVGSAPGVDLPTTIAHDFPLVSGRVVNVPIGVSATLAPGAHALVAGEVVELVIGKVTVHLALVPRPRRTLPGPRGDLRAPAYLGGSLVAHLAAWGLIIALVAPAAHATAVKPAVHAHVVPFKTPIVDAPKPTSRSIRAEPASQVAHAEPPETAVDTHARIALHDTSGGAMLAGFAQLVGAVTGHADLKKALAETGPLWREDEWAEGNFGGARRKFDPELAASETGRYATVSHGHAAGDDYDVGEPPSPPALAMCTGGSCIAIGGTDKVVIRGILAEHERAISACYTRAHARGVAEVVVDFQIAPDGTVNHAHGRGPTAVAACVADLVSSTAFPAAAEATRVRYGVAFRPAA